MLVGKLLRFFVRSVTGRAAKEERLKAEQCDRPEYHVSNAREAFAAQIMPRLSKETIQKLNEASSKSNEEA